MSEGNQNRSPNERKQSLKMLQKAEIEKSRYVATDKVVRSKSGKVRNVGNYLVTEELGRGAYGAVFKVEKSSNQGDKHIQYAMKVFQNSKKAECLRRSPGQQDDDEQRDGMLREIAIMKKLRHPHLIHLTEIIEETTDPYNIFVVMDYAAYGPIMRAKKLPPGSTGAPKFYTPVNEEGTFGEAQSSRLFREIVSGMAYLHLNKVAHRDLKPDNVVLMEDLHIKIVDFGVSSCFSDESFSDHRPSFSFDSSTGMVHDLQGTWPFWAPEMCPDTNTGQASLPKIYNAYQADVWAAGVVLWVMVFGELPFYSDSSDEMFAKIQQPLPKAPVNKSPELMNMLSSMLESNVLLRPTFTLIKKYDWIKAYTDESVEKNDESHYQEVDISESDLDNALKPAKTVNLSDEFASRLRRRVATIKQTVAEREKSRKEMVTQDSVHRKARFEDDEDSESFMFETLNPERDSPPCVSNAVQNASKQLLAQESEEDEAFFAGDSNVKTGEPPVKTGNTQPAATSTVTGGAGAGNGDGCCIVS